MMNNKGVGAVFCLISALLISARTVAAAVFMSNTTGWDRSLFQEGLNYVGSPLKTAAIVALILGFGFLISGVWQDLRK